MPALRKPSSMPRALFISSTEMEPEVSIYIPSLGRGLKDRPWALKPYLLEGRFQVLDLSWE